MVFDGCTAIVDACCLAWNRLAENPQTATPITARQPAQVSLQGRWYQLSKSTSPMIRRAAGRSLEISSRLLESAVNSPQLCTSAERATPGFTGNSWFVSA